MSTPMLRQYEAIKKEYNDSVLLFRVGDFYECYNEDAKILAESCKIVLTAKDYGSLKVPMSGVPYHSVNKYIKMLIDNGHKVAICDQIEDASKKSGPVVQREVTKVITPGTITDLMMLDDQENNYLIAITRSKLVFGLAFVDVSTGEFFGTMVKGDTEEDSIGKLISEIVRFNPTECILPQSINKDEELINKLKKYTSMTIYPREDYIFDLENARNALLEHFGLLNLHGFGCEDKPLIIKSAGAIILYLQEIQKLKENNIKKFSIYNQEDFLVIDAASQRNLELVRNIMNDTTEGTLLSILNKTITPMGSRKLKRWLKQPLLDINMIKYRQLMIEIFKEDLILRQDIRTCLKEISDIERLIGKISHGSANAKDLISLRNSIEKVPEIDKILSEKTEELKDFFNNDLIGKVLEVAELIRKSIKDDPSNTLHDGGIIKRGYNSKLDELIKIKDEGKNFLIKLENNERIRTGIKSLKVKYNKIFGYFIEVTKPNLHLVPKNYIKKQTLVNSERFFTEELKSWEEKILNAEEQVNELEYELFLKILGEIKKYILPIQATSDLISEIDIYTSLAEVAVLYNYIKPEVNNSYKIWIKNGRHPVLDVILGNKFIPNDVLIDDNQNQLLIITGPNMAGKSTYLRQVAQIVILAQMGSFIPAEKAEIGIVDQIFVRVGAYDNIVLQQSTFLVEMNETANILNNATKNSLIILDEIGRGTATFDGLSIAWAVVEYIVKTIGARTLFATHYHQLNELTKYFDNIKNYNILVKRKDNDIIFLYQITPGGCDKSYGIEVAKLAGLPHKVIMRASEILESLESGHEITVQTENNFTPKKNKRKKIVQLTFTPKIEDKKEIHHKYEKEIIEDLKNLDIHNMSPINALNKLFELQKKIKNWE
ncbi:MAG: DNA mismatch repair protein MutS [Candidatus Helarchaeota archaeon]